MFAVFAASAVTPSPTPSRPKTTASKSKTTGRKGRDPRRRLRDYNPEGVVSVGSPRENDTSATPTPTPSSSPGSSLGRPSGEDRLRNSVNTGTGGGASSPSGTTTNVYDDQGKGEATSSQRGDNNQRRPASGQQTTETPGGQKAIAFPYYYPMCLFIAGDVTQDANAAVKGLVDEAAKCQVNLLIYPITVRPLPDREAIINQYQTKACNLAERLGVGSASTSSCISGQTAPAQMCGVKLPNGGWDTNTAGCAQLHAAGGGRISEEQRERNRTANGSANLQEYSGGPGGAVPSIEKGGACTPSIVGHEALGHSQMGKPNGSDHGNGIGDPVPNSPASPGGEGTGGGGWTDTGCRTMKANAYRNDGRYKWDPNRATYYVHKQDPEKQVDLSKMKPLFGKGGDIGPNGGGGAPPSQPPIRSSRDIADREETRPRASQSSSPSGADPHKRTSSQLAGAGLDPKSQAIVDKYKNVPQGGGGGDIELLPPGSPIQAPSAIPPPVQLGAPKGSSLVYDDGAQYKNTTSSGVGSGPASVGGGGTAAGANPSGPSRGPANYGSPTDLNPAAEVSGGFGRVNEEEAADSSPGQRQRKKAGRRRPASRPVRVFQEKYNEATE